MDYPLFDNTWITHSLWDYTWITHSLLEDTWITHSLWDDTCMESNCSSHIVTPFMDVLFGVIHTRTLLGNLMSVLVTHSSVL